MNLKIIKLRLKSNQLRSYEVTNIASKVAKLLHSSLKRSQFNRLTLKKAKLGYHGFIMHQVHENIPYFSPLIYITVVKKCIAEIAKIAKIAHNFVN